MAKRKSKPLKTCADCTHEFACAMWNIGNIHNMDAANCTNYETVKDSMPYLIGLLDGRTGVRIENQTEEIVRECDERCIANVDGLCAVKSCDGPITRICDNTRWDIATAAKMYGIARESFRDYFGEEAQNESPRHEEGRSV